MLGEAKRDAATRCVLRPVDASKYVRGRGSAPYPAGGAYNADGLKLEMGRKEKGKEGVGNEGRRDGI